MALVDLFSYRASSKDHQVAAVERKPQHRCFASDTRYSGVDGARAIVEILQRNMYVYTDTYVDRTEKKS